MKLLNKRENSKTEVTSSNWELTTPRRNHRGRLRRQLEFWAELSPELSLQLPFPAARTFASRISRAKSPLPTLLSHSVPKLGVSGCFLLTIELGRPHTSRPWRILWSRHTWVWTGRDNPASRANFSGSSKKHMTAYQCNRHCIFAKPSWYQAGRVDLFPTLKKTKKGKAQVQASFLKQSANQLNAVLTALLTPLGQGQYYHCHRNKICPVKTQICLT